MSDMHRPIVPSDTGASPVWDKPATQPPPPSTDTVVLNPLDWVRHFFGANPFYLASVVLLLYGIYRITADDGFVLTEVRQLFFNFSALQCYELAAVALAVFLARRRVWYDSTLLALLENLVVIVPFILITQASLIDQGWLWGFCAAGIGLAVMRLGALKRWLPELNLPWPLLGIGVLLLAVNAAWPIIYRELQEERMARTITWGPAYLMNEWSWLVILPALVAGAHLLPALRTHGALWPQRRWVPLAVLGMWLVASTVHLYALSYVYTFAMRPAHWAPVLVILAWTLCHRLPRWLERCPAGWQAFFMVNSFVWMFLALAPKDSGVLLSLAVLNMGLYGVAVLRNVRRLLAIQLGMASALTALAVASRHFEIAPLDLEFTRVGWGGVLAVYVMAASFFSRRAAMGVLCAVGASVLTALVIRDSMVESRWMVHIALMGILLHSFRWDDIEHAFHSWFRWLAAMAWMSHSLVWAWNEGPTLALAANGGAMILAWLAVFGVRKVCPPPAIVLAGVTVMLSGPGEEMIAWVRTAPVGALSIAGSFLLLALGTVAALTKGRWHRSEPPCEAGQSPPGAPL